jgi:hypothetical protein
LDIIKQVKSGVVGKSIRGIGKLQGSIDENMRDKRQQNTSSSALRWRWNKSLDAAD